MAHMCVFSPAAHCQHDGGGSFTSAHVAARAATCADATSLPPHTPLERHVKNSTCTGLGAEQRRPVGWAPDVFAPDHTALLGRRRGARRLSPHEPRRRAPGRRRRGCRWGGTGTTSGAAPARGRAPSGGPAAAAEARAAEAGSMLGERAEHRDDRQPNVHWITMGSMQQAQEHEHGRRQLVLSQ